MGVSWLAYGAGALLRLVLSSSSFLQDRPEISNPINAWKRLVEGIHLNKLGRWSVEGFFSHVGWSRWKVNIPLKKYFPVHLVFGDLELEFGFNLTLMKLERVAYGTVVVK